MSRDGAARSNGLIGGAPWCLKRQNMFLEPKALSVTNRGQLLSNSHIVSVDRKTLKAVRITILSFRNRSRRTSNADEFPCNAKYLT